MLHCFLFKAPLCFLVTLHEWDKLAIAEVVLDIMVKQRRDRLVTVILGDTLLRLQYR